MEERERVGLEDQVQEKRRIGKLMLERVISKGSLLILKSNLIRGDLNHFQIDH